MEMQSEVACEPSTGYAMMRKQDGMEREGRLCGA